jgi:transcriptional regulator with XRE-family HTH domain
MFTVANMKITGKQIKAIREQLRMTQEEFAEKLGLSSRGAVSALERGHRQAKGPLLAHLRGLAAVPKTTRRR